MGCRCYSGTHKLWDTESASSYIGSGFQENHLLYYLHRKAYTGAQNSGTKTPTLTDPYILQEQCLHQNTPARPSLLFSQTIKKNHTHTHNSAASYT